MAHGCAPTHAGLQNALLPCACMAPMPPEAAQCIATSASASARPHPTIVLTSFSLAISRTSLSCGVPACTYRRYAPSMRVATPFFLCSAATTTLWMHSSWPSSSCLLMDSCVSCTCHSQGKGQEGRVGWQGMAGEHGRRTCCRQSTTRGRGVHPPLSAMHGVRCRGGAC